MGKKSTDMLTALISFLSELARHLIAAVRKEDKTHLCSLLVILLLAIGVRLVFLFQPMKYDEAWTFMDYAAKPFYMGLSDYPTTNTNNHLFHTLLVRVAYLVLGNNPWIIRLPALFAGILLIPASYVVTRAFYNKEAALLTAGIVASSSALVEYSTSARGYTLICLIFLLILALATRLKQSANSAAWLLFAILSALGFYTIPTMLYPFGMVVIWLFLSIIFEKADLSRSLLLKRLFIFSIIAALLTVMLYLPVLVVSGLESVLANKVIASKSWSDFVANIPAALRSIWDRWNRDIPVGIQFLLVIGFLISLVFHKRLSCYRVPIILAAGIWIVPVLTVQRVIPPSRIWLFLLPLYAGLASSGITYILKPIESRIGNYKSVALAVLATALSVWLSLNVVQTKSVYYSRDWGRLRNAEEVAIFLKDYLKPGDGVHTVDVARPTLEYYFTLHEVPVGYLSSDVEFCHRMLLIVNEPNERLEKILDRAGASVGEEFQDVFANWSMPKLIKRYEFASLYEIHKMKVAEEK